MKGRISLAIVTAASIAPLAHAETPKPVEVVNGVWEYVLVGVSASSVDNTAGLSAHHAACQASFGPAARMCTTVEAANSPNLTSLELSGVAKLQPVIASTTYGVAGLDPQVVFVATYDVTGVVAARGGTIESGGDAPLFTPSLNCRHWSIESVREWFAAIVAFDEQPPTLGALQCDNTPSPVACCVPRSQQ